MEQVLTTSPVVWRGTVVLRVGACRPRGAVWEAMLLERSW